MYELLKDKSLLSIFISLKPVYEKLSSSTKITSEFLTTLGDAQLIITSK